jgi:hypothetical protein
MNEIKKMSKMLSSLPTNQKEMILYLLAFIVGYMICMSIRIGFIPTDYLPIWMIPKEDNQVGVNTV